MHGSGAILILFLDLLFDFFILPSNDLFFSFDEFQHLPANFFAIFIETLEIRSNIGDNFSGLILLDEANDGEDIEDLRYEILQIEIFLLIHKRLHNLFDTLLGDHILLINKRVEDPRQ